MYKIQFLCDAIQHALLNCKQNLIRTCWSKETSIEELGNLTNECVQNSTKIVPFQSK